MLYVIRGVLCVIILMVSDILFFRYFLKMRIKKELYCIALVANAVAFVVGFGVSSVSSLSR